jgi:hypothetical protein
LWRTFETRPQAGSRPSLSSDSTLSAAPRVSPRWPRSAARIGDLGGGISVGRSGSSERCARGSDARRGADPGRTDLSLSPGVVIACLPRGFPPLQDCAPRHGPTLDASCDPSRRIAMRSTIQASEHAFRERRSTPVVRSSHALRRHVRSPADRSRRRTSLPTPRRPQRSRGRSSRVHRAPRRAARTRPER